MLVLNYSDEVSTMSVTEQMEEIMNITSAALQRTFRIRLEDSVGSCFTVNVDGRGYVVTARHMADGIENRRAVELWHDGVWKRLPVELVGHGTGGVDITVLAPKQRFGGGYPIKLDGGFVLGEEVFFLGYPFGEGSRVGTMNSDFPVPWVKRGIVSAFDTERGVVYLDGHNNPGFSGGPVVQKSGSEPRILGVISGYRRDRRKALDDSGLEAPYTYDLNTGIVLAYNVQGVVQMVKDNPIGFPIP